MWQSRALGTFTFVVVMLALPSTRAYDDRFHGSICVGRTATDAGKLLYDHWGARNSSTSGTAKVLCPMGYISSGASFGATIWHDHSSHVVTCSYFLGDHAGYEVFSGGTFRPGLAPWGANPYAHSAELLDMSGYLYLECDLPSVVGGLSSIVASVWLND
jgi:hypothetical protein